MDSKEEILLELIEYHGERTSIRPILDRNLVCLLETKRPFTFQIELLTLDRNLVGRITCLSSENFGAFVNRLTKWTCDGVTVFSTPANFFFPGHIPDSDTSTKVHTPRVQHSPDQIRKMFESEVKRIGYHGPLDFNAELGTYESTHDTAMFAGFRIGLGMAKSGSVLDWFGAGVNVGKSMVGVEKS